MKTIVYNMHSTSEVDKARIVARCEGKIHDEVESAARARLTAVAAVSAETAQNGQWAEEWQLEALEYQGQIEHVQWNVSYHEDWQQQEFEQEHAANEKLRRQLQQNAEAHTENQATVRKMILDDNVQKEQPMASVTIEVETLRGQLAGAVARQNTLGGKLYEEECEARQLRAEKSAGVFQDSQQHAIKEHLLMNLRRDL